MDAETAHRALEHAVSRATPHGEAAAHGDIPELPNFITILSSRWHDYPAVAWLHQWENLVFSLIVAAGLVLITFRYTRRPKTIPTGWQNALEIVVEGFDNLARSIMGRAGREHVPFIGTLFLYIWLMNLSGLIPGMKSATSSLNTTIGLALVVFCYVQWIGISRNGLFKYLDHLAGSPRDVFSWILVPLMLPIHVMGELIKPVSLSLRLGINVFAEDLLLAILVGLGLTVGAALHSPIGMPFQALVLPLVLIFSTVQALVFSLLSSVYISLMLPHGAGHGEHHGEERAAAHS